MIASKKNVTAVLALAAALGANLPEVSMRARDKQTRKFTDARKAAAELKRQRKNAKRRAQATGE